MPPLSLHINGTTRQVDVEPRTRLLDALRDHVGLTGTKKGCDQGACGACTVLADGERVLSCLALAIQYEHREITTIEGVDHPLQQAFAKHDAFQCGYCTPGQLCSAVGMLNEHRAGMPSAATEDVTTTPPLTRAEIQERMSGNLCRCGAYNGIVAAIEETAR